MNLARVRLITFDITGTLLQFRYPPGQLYSNIGAIYGVKCDPNNVARNFKIQWNKMCNLYPNFGSHSKIGWEAWWKMVVIGTFENSSDSINSINDKEILNKIATDLIEIYKKPICWEYCQGTIKLLDFFKEKKIPLGVISNFDQRLITVLESMKLHDYFAFIINSVDAGCEKPNNQIFEKALISSKIENIKPAEALHIGNNPITDYLGAKNAGWNSILINNNDFDENIKHVDPNHVYKTLIHYFMDVRSS